MMLNRKVDLRFPIEIPGCGMLSTITAYPLFTEDYHLAGTGPEGQLQAFANCVRLHPEVAAEIDAQDYDEITTVIADLNRQAAEEVRAKRPTLTLIKGDKQ